MDNKSLLEKFETMQTCYLATYDGEFPRVRPMILIQHEGRFWLATGTEDDKTLQIKNHPKVALSVTLSEGDNESYVRIKGIAKHSQDPAERTAIWNIATYISRYWDSPEHPGFGLVEVKPVAISYMAPNTTVEIDVEL